MTMTRQIHRYGGSVGTLPVVIGWADSTFDSELDALETAGTDINGANLKVSFTWSDDYEFTSPADGAAFDGELIRAEKVNTATGTTWKLSVELWRVTDDQGTVHYPRAVRTIPYDGTIALQDTIIINGSDYKKVDVGNASGDFVVIGVDSTNGTVDVAV